MWAATPVARAVRERLESPGLLPRHSAEASGGRSKDAESTDREGFGGLVERIEPACALPFRQIEPELRPRE
jgi:hypothetical protein